jgi:uncharacterized protein YecT (DUF1311 family)
MLLRCVPVAGADSIPEPLAGMWQVSSVLVDTHATRKLNIQPNDPRLRLRIMNMSGDRIEFEAAGGSCSSLTISKEKRTLIDLLKASEEMAPSANNYRLPVSGDAPVEVFWVKAAVGHPGPANPNWIAITATNQLAVPWYDGAILLLDRLAEDAKPSPSFDPARASSATEKAISRSVSLSAFDKSIAEAYAAAMLRMRLKAETERGKALAKSQREWLRTRDQCGADIKCLEKSLRERLNAIAELEAN